MLKTSHLQELKRRYASMYIKEEPLDDQFNEHCGVCDEQGIEEEVELDEELEAIYSNFQEIYENLDEDEQDDFDAILELHEEGEITDEELVEGLMDYATKSGRAKKKLARMQKKTDKMTSKIAAKKQKRSDDLSVKRKISGEKSKQRKIKAKAKADKKANPSKLRKGLKKVGGALKKVFGKSESVDESNELQAIMALDDVGIEASINKKDQVVVKKKDLKKAEKALKKSFRKGGAPELHVEEVELDEKGVAYPSTIDNLRMIVKDKQHQTFMFKSGQAKVDLFTASAMVQVYDAMKKPEMKKKFEDMIKDKAGFLKTQAFAMKMLSGGK